MNKIMLYFSILCIFYIILFILQIIFSKKNNVFDTYFGVPGSGKTTMAAWCAKKSLKKNRIVYSNVAIKGTYKFERSDLGHYDMSHSLIISDEAGIDFDNRNYSTNFDNQQVKFLKKHRHYDCDLVFFSQYWNDIDIKLRNLSTRLFLIKKSFIPFFIVRKKIGKRIGIDPNTKEIIDEYYFVPGILGGTRRIFSPTLWKMFDTHSKEELPKKHFLKW